MKKILLFCLLLTGCAAQKFSTVPCNDIVELKQELTIAQKKLEQQMLLVEQLKEQIARNEISLIQKEITQVDKREAAKKMLSHDQWLSFFYQQREILGDIIRNHPTCRVEAQEVLDQILTLITQLSDQDYE